MDCANQQDKLFLSAALTYYMVFEHDFGPNRHVFTWVRPGNNVSLLVYTLSTVSSIIPSSCVN